MPRVSVQINSNKNDIIKLNNIINNSLSTQKYVNKAKVILKCIEGKQNKEIAEEFGLRENTIGKWRKEFAEKGFDSFNDKARAGRRGNGNPNVREQIIQVYREELVKGNELSVNELKEMFNTSVDTVRRAFKDAGIEYSKKRLWTINVENPSFNNTVGLAGIYLSKNQCAVVLYTSNTRSNASVNSYFTTFDSNITKHLDKSAPVAMVDVLELFLKEGKGINKKGNRNISIQNYLRNLGNVPDDVSLFAFVLDENGTVQRNVSITNLAASVSNDKSLWLNSITAWLLPLCPDEADKISTVLSEYIDNRSEYTLPIIWQANFVPAITDNISDADSIDTEVTEPNNVFKITISASLKNGKTINKTGIFENALPSFDDICYDSPLALASSVGKLERGVSQALNQVGKSLCEDYMEQAQENVKKN